ncbi:MAG: outer membrane beta-barrel protein [Bacteroidales bacterium]|nr:outer membrane beta-barrel protein [Bacteroidales bacterium]
MKKEIIKKILVCICLTLCMMPQLLNAQKKKPLNIPNYDNEPYHYGFIVGYNQMLFSVDYIDGYQNIIHSHTEFPPNNVMQDIGGDFLTSDFRIDEITPMMTHGFSVGIVGNLRLTRHLDLRLIPTLSFGERRIIYNIVSTSVIDDNGDFKRYKVQSDTHSTFVEFPLHLKIRSNRNNNTSAYVIAGANYKIDMASQKKLYDEDANRPNALRVNRHDVAAEVGAGFDFYTGYFKLGIELKMSYGLLDVAKDHDFMYTSSFDNLRNKTFQLSFTFE